VLNGGVLQQLDTPQAVYDRPANLFVARFIGSPAMNVLPGRLETSGNGLEVVAAGLRLPLAPAQAAAADALDSADVLLGIRPEHLTLDGAASPGGGIAGQVELVERLGSESFAYVETGDGTITARLPAEIAAQVGQQVRLTVRDQPFHLFDPRTEQALRAD
jgi:multiple sugar transport system ATP-binding protein